jgi:hypothetical protein
MSEIVRQLRASIEANSESLKQLAASGKLLRMKATLDNIVNELAEEHGVEIQMNFPKKSVMRDVDSLGIVNVSLFAQRKQKKLIGISKEALGSELARRYPESKITDVGHGWEGFNIQEDGDRIIVLPGAVHFWRRLSQREMDLLDWLFAKVFMNSKNTV